MSTDIPGEGAADEPLAYAAAAVDYEAASEAVGAVSAQQEMHVEYAPPPAADLPADAVVTVYGGLLFCTTGASACQVLGVPAEQLALTPSVALRIAAVLRETLQSAELQQRKVAIEVWSASELASMPHGRVWIDELAVHFTIEPLGAGAQITVAWPYVPGLIVALETAAYQAGAAS